MAEFTATEWIYATPNAVFNFMLTPDNAHKVMPSVKENVQITEGPVDVGTRFRETRLINGKEATAEIEVTTFEPPRRYSATSSQGGITATYHYTLAPEQNGTRIKLQAEVAASGVKKLVVPMILMMMKKQDGDHLQNLKRAVESQERPDSSA